MRLRNLKRAQHIINESKYIVHTPNDFRGKWHTLFNNNNPIHVEIGMGKGKFILENALQYPNINFIGIEKYDSIIARAIKKIDSYEINNINLIRMDAINIDVVFYQEINRIYLNFSDPWPKKRHANRRLTSNFFLQKYEHIFKDKKEIFLKTDNIQLFDYSLLSLSDYGYNLKNVSYDLVNSAFADNITTEYEEKFLNDNINIYRVEAYKD
jgi:tRNA (guanine-N7-)-methyltransferase